MISCQLTGKERQTQFSFIGLEISKKNLENQTLSALTLPIGLALINLY